jgi:hypothetical protein
MTADWVVDAHIRSDKFQPFLKDPTRMSKILREVTSNLVRWTRIEQSILRGIESSPSLHWQRARGTTPGDLLRRLRLLSYWRLGGDVELTSDVKQRPQSSSL